MGPIDAAPLRVCYLVHDLGDPAVPRRVRMLQDGGAAVSVAGFSRAAAPDQVAGMRPVVLGRTESGRLARRVGTVALAAFHVGALRAMVREADVIMARQLEALALVLLARWLFAPATPVVFECLDVHRAMLGGGGISALLRRVEAWALRRCALLIVSSPGFVDHHFSRYPVLPPVRLIENKVLASEVGRLVARPAGRVGPWRIGWFGVIRCARSLALLAELVRSQAGRVEVSIRGLPALDAVPAFYSVVQTTPGLHYGGPYDRGADLARIYGEVDFTWAIDCFEAGGNSDWLLPNRLYEGGLHGSVPLALATAPMGATPQTGLWLRDRNAGILLDEPLERSLDAFFAQLSPESYAAAAARTIPIEDVVHDRAACKQLVAEFSGLRFQADRRSKVRTSMAL